MGLIQTIRKSTRKAPIKVPMPDRSTVNAPTGATAADQARIVSESPFHGGTAPDGPGLLKKLGRRK